MALKHDVRSCSFLSRQTDREKLIDLIMAQLQPKMQKEPPNTHRVPGGDLLFHPNRDGRLPYLYIVQSHPLVDRSKLRVDSPGRTLVYVQDTSKETMKAQAEFEDTLEVPLGPDELMVELGQF